jgi:mono/diheme cytochrome c family protein
MIVAAMKRRILVLAVFAVAASAVLSACGSQSVSSSVKADSATVQAGATLFAQRCAGCHSFDAAGAQGSATKVSDREKVDGPDLSVRKVCYEAVLYALQNGGYSGAIMPGNIAVGKEAEQVAAFVAKYSGENAPTVASPTGPAVGCPPVPAGAGQ